MNRAATQSNLTTQTSEKAKHSPAYYALLAKVGHQKRKALAYRDERDFYYGIVTELLVPLGEAVEFLQQSEKKVPTLRPLVSSVTSQQHHSVRRLLNFWPQGTESRQKILDLLDADGLATVLGTTADGYLSLSSDLILENVERIIDPTKKESSPNR